MSSFVIGKVSYVRVAGLCAGLAKGTENGFRRFWIWDRDRQCPMDERGFTENFCECYKLNVDSVCKQYKDDNPDAYLDDCDYKQDFDRYFKVGKMCAYDNDLLQDVIKELVFFARSVSYQIEDDIDAQIVNEWFNAVIVAMMAIADTSEHDSWGSFDLPTMVPAAV